MDDASPGRHELQIPLVQQSLFACEIFMFHRAGEHVRNRLLSPVRMFAEARAGRDKEMIEHEEWSQVFLRGNADAATDLSAYTFGLGGGGVDF